MARAALAASRAIQIIDFLAAQGTTQFTLSELARALDINVASPARHPSGTDQKRPPFAASRP